MHILDWKQCRSKLLGGIAALDVSIAARAMDLEAMWNESALEGYENSELNVAEQHDMASVIEAENETYQQEQEQHAPDIDVVANEIPEYLR